jgi:hypothetical protein
MLVQTMPIAEQYLQLLNLTYEVAQSLKGKASTDPRLPDCQQLMTKLFFHVATIYDLRQGTKVPVPYSEGGAFFYDFASVAVIARAALETYLTLFEVFLGPTSDDEFEFNHALWQLSGFIIREDFIPSDPAFSSKVASFQKEIQEMRDRLQRTKKFNSMSKKQKDNLLKKGSRTRDWTYIAKETGFGEKTIRQIYKYYSGYVHADGLSGTQIVTARTKEEQIEYIEGHMQKVMIILSKAIIGYGKKFSEAKVICDKNPEAFYLAEIWSGAAEHVP